MKNTLGLLVMLMSLVLAAAGCGDKKDDVGGSGGAVIGDNVKGSRFAEGANRDGSCSKAISDDAEKLGNELQGIEQTVEGLKKMRATIVAFRAKWNGVVCTAKNEETGAVESFNVTEITGNWLKQIDSALGNAGGTQPGTPTPPQTPGNGGNNGGGFPGGGFPGVN